jgi:tetratricopeptide (TPR) repeat protein
MPVVITTPPPRMRPNALARARRAAERAWSARLAWVRRARSALPNAKALGNRAAHWLPPFKTFGRRAAQLLPQAKRLLPDAKRLLPNAKRLSLPARRMLPKAKRWAQRTVRSVPRSVLVTAPFVALFVIWLVHGIASRHRHAPQPTALAQPTAAHVGAGAPAVAHTAIAVAEPTPIAAAVIAPTATTIPPAVPVAADDTELRSAVSQGLPAMQALAAKYAADPQVLVALASAEAQAQRYEAAIATIERALEAAPSTTQNGKIMGLLWRAAQSPAAEESFECLRKLGARGSDVEFDLATTSGVRDAVRDRAKAELADHMALDASSDTRAAAALLLAPDCATRKSLLPRAERDGGKRTLAMLERFARGVGCTSSSVGSCNSCLMGSPVLAQAISKLSAGAKP